jgi:hypothetical protein
MNSMNHEIYQQRISQFVDNELSESLEPDLFLHLRSCKECRGFLKSSWRIQNDILCAKPLPASGSFRQTHQDRAMNDKHPVPLSVNTERNHRTTTARFSTMILLVLMLIVGGLLFSAKVEVLPPQQETTSPAGLSSLDSSFKR